jgi:hypothetical protein
MAAPQRFTDALRNTRLFSGLAAYNVSVRDLRKAYERHEHRLRMFIKPPEEPPHSHSPVAVANAAWQGVAAQSWDMHTTKTSDEKFDGSVYRVVNLMFDNPYDPDAAIGAGQLVGLYQDMMHSRSLGDPDAPMPPGSP